MRRFLAAQILCATLLAAAHGETYLVSSFDTLYRFGPGHPLENFNLGPYLRGMHRDTATGTVYVVQDSGPAATFATIYTLNNAESGTPSLSEFSVLTHRYGTMTQIGNLFYGFDNGNLYTIDLTNPSSPVETFIGNTGVTQTAGSGYDPVSNTLYMASYGTDRLYRVNPATAAATTVGGTFGINALDLGAEWFNGQFYLGVQNGTSGDLEVGTVSVTTGAYTYLYTVSDNTAIAVATGLTIIPEPSTLVLLLIAGTFLARRRS